MREEVGLTISVGVSFNRAFAKLGSDYKKPDATTVFSRENFHERVWPLPVNTLLYVGRRAAARLDGLGVHTIGDLAACEPVFLHSIFGKQGDVLLRYARGEDDEPVRSFYAEREVKSVGNGMTFAHNLLGEERVPHGVDRAVRQRRPPPAGRAGWCARPCRSASVTRVSQPFAADDARAADQFHPRAV